jgi:SAM-dependent methyltransferase
MTTCPFCEGEPTERSIVASERMFGLGGTFIYSQCSACASLFMAEPPADLSPFYPPGYYSYARANRSLVTAISEDVSARLHAAGYVRFLRQCGMQVNSSTAFVDVGCGSGDLLRALRTLGFSRGAGIDPYLRDDIDTGGIAVHRRPIDELVKDEPLLKADVVMFHHSLEHVADPAASLRAAVKLLLSRGLILVRIPIVSYAWERYGDKWVGLDAPRHLSLPTENGFATLVKRIGLRIIHSRYDSTAMQFLASEAYERGQSLREAFASNPPKTLLRTLLAAPKSIAARRLNRQRRGDQAAFALVVDGAPAGG